MSVRQLWWAKWTPRPQAVFTVWLMKTKIIRVHVVSREQAYQWVEEGKIDNAASVIALQWLQLHHQALKNEWA